MMTTIIAGNLTRDVEMTIAKSGTEIANFSVAVNHWNGKENVASFYNCVAFGHKAKYLSKCTKGQILFLQGKHVQENYTDKNGEKKTVWKLIIDEACIGSNNGREQPRENQRNNAPVPSYKNSISDDTVPF